MIIREEAGRKNAAAEANPYHWPKSYYMEDDGEKEKNFLIRNLPQTQTIHPTVCGSNCGISAMNG